MSRSIKKGPFAAPELLKRGMPRAKGRYNRILKRTTHITIGVSEKA